MGYTTATTHRTRIFTTVNELEHGLTDPSYSSLLQAARSCQGNTLIDTATITKWMTNTHWGIRYGAMYAAIGRPKIPYSLIEQGLNDADPDVRMIALRACACRDDVPIERYDEALNDKASYVAEAAAKSIRGKPVPADIRATWATSHNPYRRIAAEVSVDA